MYLAENESSKRENLYRNLYWIMPSIIVVCSLTKIDQRASMSESTPIGILSGRRQMETAFWNTHNCLLLPKLFWVLVMETWYQRDGSQSTNTSFQSMEIRSKRILSWLWGWWKMSYVQLVVWVISRSQNVFCSPSKDHNLLPGTWKESQSWSRTKKEGERTEGTRKKEQVEKEKTKSKLNRDISFTKDCIKKLESTLFEANQDISNALKAPVLVKQRIVKAHALIDMSLERKRNLEKTLDELVGNKQKIS